MEKLHTAYADALMQVAEQIQQSETLSQYLDEEDENMYKQLQDEFEPTIGAIYDQVAHENPLMLIGMEQLLLHSDFEGLFLPRILGYAVLRPTIDKNHKYTVPQNHFKDILLSICNSPNFEQIKKRIGQTTTIGFALSSDIWITNLIDGIENKKIKQYLAGLKSDGLREHSKRSDAYNKYKNQFTTANFLSTEFPQNQIQFISTQQSLKEFLLFRSQGQLDNNSLLPHLKNLINNNELKGELYLEILLVIGLKHRPAGDLATDYINRMKSILDQNQANTEIFFELYDRLLGEDLVTPEDEKSLLELLQTIDSQELQAYRKTASVVHSLGLINPDTIEAVRSFYENHKGLSQENECLRMIVTVYIKRLLLNLEPDQYLEYIDMNNKVFKSYIDIFSNELFNQELKEASMTYIKNCFKVYTDKRGKEYQEIKKFVSSGFVEMGFLTDKQVVEMFKTKRKPAAEK